MTTKSATPAPPAPPPAAAILVAYSVLGALLSFAFGRDPSSSGTLLPDDVARELAPTLIVICLFLVSYSVVDVMTVGILKAKHGMLSKPYPAVASNPPEEVYVAQRVQTNQVEQLPGFLVGAVSFSLLVDGRVGAAMSLAWAALRRGYARAYRTAAGRPIGESNIAKFTIPAYFILNSMLMGTVVQCLRALAHGSQNAA